MGLIGSLKDASYRAASWASSSPGIASLFGVGLVLRLVLAQAEGFPFDIATFSAWAERLQETGPWGFYPDPGEEFFVDYPPGYLYVLWALGALANLLGEAAPSAFMLKLPGILADLGTAWVAVLLADRLTPPALRRRFPYRGVVAAAILLNPAVIFISAVWGQVESLQSFFLLGAFLFLATGRATFPRESAGLALVVVAIGTKPQAAFVLPFIGLLFVWRHVRSAVGERAGRGPRRVAGGFAVGLGRIAALGLVALVAGLAFMAPFGLGPVGAWRFYTEAAGTYTVTSVFAFNFWGAVGFWRPDLEGPDAVRLLGVPAFFVGLGAFALVVAGVLMRAWRSLWRGELEARILVFGGAAVTCLAFATLTRTHERYLFLAVACLAPLVAYRAFRRSLIALSLVYLVNVYFPYVYYLDYTGEEAPTIGPLFRAVYGTALDSPQIQALSIGTALLCLFIAWRGWSWLERRSGAAAGREPPTPPREEPVAAAGAQPDRPAPRPPSARWSLGLHRVGVRGAIGALVVLALVAGTRLAGLGDPPGMYFDEVYHARTGGEYLEGKPVFEWTHPPLAKELMAVSLLGVGGFGVHERGPAPEEMGAGPTATDDGAVLWAVADGGASGRLWRGRFESGCAVSSATPPTPLDVRPAALAVEGDSAYVGGMGDGGAELVRWDETRERWRVPLPDVPEEMAVVEDAVFVVTADGSLTWVSDTGETAPLATGAAHLAAGGDTGLVWVSFPDEGRVTPFSVDGTSREGVDMRGEPGPLAAPRGTPRVVVADGREPRLEAIDTDGPRREGEVEGAADELATVGDTGLAWAADGARLRAVEPWGMTVLGEVTLEQAPVALLADAERDHLVALGDGELRCVSGRPAFAWRLGSAVTGAGIAALVFLIAVRLFGSMFAGGMAALFVAVDGLAFTLSRIAMNDSYVTAFALAAVFCVLSCLRRAGPATDPASGETIPGSRWVALGWLLGCGAFIGLGLASKWVAAYAAVGIGLLLLWDARMRGRQGIWGLAGGPVRTLGVFAGALGLLPLAVYVGSYVPFFALGNTAGDLVGLHGQMYTYHAQLTATHPFGSSWYGWPFGHRAIWMYAGEAAGGRAEIWAAGNPVVFLGGLAALVLLAVVAWRRRSAALAVVPLMALVQYLPWALVGRVTFLYHYLPVVPFLALALGWWVAGGGRERLRARPRRAIPVALLAVGAFAALLPLLAGLPLDPGYHETVRSLLPWVF